MPRCPAKRLFYPPDVGGWNDERWLDTATFRGRWLAASQVLKGQELKAPSGARDPHALLERARGFWGNPALTSETRTALLRFARRAFANAGDSSERAGIENALRQLIAVSPELQTS